MESNSRETGIRLYFDGSGLYRVAFNHPLLGGEKVSVRGKNGSYYNQYLSFQWTSAVRGLALLLAKTKLSSLSSSMAEPVLDGGRGSLAASLDYALNKQPAWLSQMFGTDKRGRPLALRFIHRENPLRKRGEKVALSINSSLPPERISIQVRGHEADEVALKSLHQALSKSTVRNTAGSYQALATFPGVLSEEIRLSLSANDIFSEPKLRRTLEKFTVSRTFQKISEGHQCSLSSIDLTLSPEERIGLRQFDRKVLRAHPLRVSIAIGHVASQALMLALKESESLPIEIDYANSHSSGFVYRHVEGDQLPPLLCLSLAPSAKLIGLGERCSYLPVMMLPSQRVSLIEKRTERGPGPKGVEYFLLTGEFSTGQMVYDQLMCRKLMPEKHVITHVEPHEILSAMEECRYTCRSILGFPYNYFSSAILNQAEFLDLPPDLVWKETFLFAHRDLFKRPEILKALDLALRNVWLALLEDRNMRSRAARQLSGMEGYMQALRRHAGIAMRSE